MSYGLQVQNAGGDLVIDADFRNYQILVEGTSTHFGTGLSAFVDVSFTATARPPLVFVRSTVWGLGQASMTRNVSGLYNTARLYSDAPFNTFSFDWFVAAPVDSASGDAWGMQVFNGAGLKVFDTGARYLQFRDVVPVSLQTLAADFDGTIDVTHASVADAYYCLAGLRAFVSAQIYEYPATFFPTVRALSATSARIGYIDRAWSGQLAASYTPAQAYLIVASRSA